MKSKIVLKTKIKIPNHKSNTIRRNILVKKLDSGTNKILTTITAPSGFGKTLGVIDWIKKSNKKNIAWFSIDSNDNQLSKFFYYFIHSLNNIFQDRFFNSLISLNNNRFDDAIYLFINELSSIEEDIFFVIDDFQLVKNENIKTKIDFILKNVTKNIHFYLISSQKIDLSSIYSLKIKDELNEVLSKDLSFEKEHILKYFNKNISDQNIEKILEQTEGWPLGVNFVYLKYLENPKLDFNKQKIFFDTNITIFFEELISQFDDKYKELLYKTSLLEYFDYDFLLRFLDYEQSKIFLSEIENKISFLQQIDSSFFRYHNLFKSFLREKLFYSKINIEELYFQISNYLKSKNCIEDAIDFLINNNQINLALELIEDVILDLFSKNKYSLLSFWIKHIKDDILFEKPKILVIKILISILFESNYDLNKYIFFLEKRMYELDSNKSESFSFVSSFYFIQSCFYKRELDFIKTIEYLEKSLEFCFPKDFQLNLINFNLAYANFSLGNLNESKKLFSKVNFGLDYYNKILLKRYQSLILEDLGDLNASRIIYMSSLDYLEKNSLIYTKLCSYIKRNYSYILYNINDILELKKQLDESIFISKYIKDNNHLLHLIASKMYFHTLMGETEQAKNCLDELDSFINELYPLKDYNFKSNLLAKKNYLLMKLNLFSEIEDYIQSLKNYLFSENYVFELHMELPFLVLVKFYLFQKNFEESLFILDLLLKKIEGKEFNKFRINLLVIMASIYLEKNNEKLAEELIFKALNIPKKGGFIRVFIDDNINVFNFIKNKINLNSKKYHHLFDYIQAIISSEDLKNNSININNLSIREREVIYFVKKGFSNLEISKKLYISENTVKTHLKNIYKKLGIKSRVILSKI